MTIHDTIHAADPLDRPMSLSPGSRLGLYDVLALIGIGGMGEVYRARDTRRERDVAVKVLPDLVSSDPGGSPASSVKPGRWRR
jgi:serine/threonine protein kinase